MQPAFSKRFPVGVATLGETGRFTIPADVLSASAWGDPSVPADILVQDLGEGTLRAFSPLESARQLEAWLELLRAADASEDIDELAAFERRHFEAKYESEGHRIRLGKEVRLILFGGRRAGADSLWVQARKGCIDLWAVNAR
jgi:hypothetical protein